MKQFILNRRSFLFSMVAAPIAFLASVARAAQKTVTTTAADATKALVKEKDAMPSALKYSEVASKAPTRTKKESNCANCMHFSKAVGADGAAVKVGGSEVGACALFDAGKGYVKAGGWCMSWFQAPPA
jgi:hypothetical protein